MSTESAWYTAMATYYKNNPYVWFGTNNEPALQYTDGKTYATGPNSLAAWQSATYNAIRGTGNTNPIFLEPSGSRPPGYGGTPLMSYTDSSYIAPMTNVIWDPHIYWYQNNYATDRASNNALVSAMITASQSIKSADGVVPVIIGEYGPYGNGSNSGEVLITAIHNAGVGTAAWVWDNQGVVGGPSGDPTGAGNNSLLSGGVVTNPYGTDVKAHILANSKTIASRFQAPSSAR